MFPLLRALLLHSHVQTVLALKEVVFWGHPAPNRAGSTRGLQAGRRGFLEATSELTLGGPVEVGPEEVGSGGTHGGGTPGGGPSSAKGLEVKKKRRRVYKEQCGRRRAWKAWLAWHDQLGGLTGC